VAFIWFVLAVVFFILWLTKKDSSTSVGGNYSQGYWDGYRALGEKAQTLLKSRPVDHRAIQKEINLGFGITEIDEPQPQEESSEPVSAQDATPAATALMPQAMLDELQPKASSSVYSTPAAVQAPPVYEVRSFELTPEQKAARSLRNLNILLFMGSILLVSAGAAFIATSMPNVVKLIGVWAMVAGFYAAGVLLLRSARLKPAATAFLGTGLGILPFAGVALHQYAGMSGPTAWALTSLIGIVAYFVAALLLRSQVVSYLTLAFVISLAASSSGALSMPLVLSFVLIILVALACSVVAYLRPTWIPSIFSEPIERTGQIVTPVTLLASLVLFSRMSLLSYEIVFAVATAHYAVAWLQQRKLLYETAVRSLAHVSILLVGYDLVDGTEHVARNFGIIWLVVTSLHVALSLLLWAKKKGDLVRTNTETVWYACLTMLQFVSLGFWVRDTYSAELTSLALLLIGAGSLVLALITRQVGAAILGLFVSFVFPLTFLGGVLELDKSWQVVWFVVAMLLMVVGYLLRRQRSSLGARTFLVGAYLSYWLLALLLSIGEAPWILTALIFVGVGLLYLTSYWERTSAVALTVVAWLLLVPGIMRLWWHADPDSSWIMLGGLLATSVLSYGVSFIHLVLGDRARRAALIVLTAGLLFISPMFGVAVPHAMLYIGLTWLALSSIQAIYSLGTLRTQYASNIQEQSWLAGALGVQCLTIFFWMNEKWQAELTILSLVMVGLTSLAATFVLRRIVWAYVGLGASLLAAPVFLLGVLNLSDNTSVVAWFVAGMLLLLGGRVALSSRSEAVRTFLTMSYASYYAAALLAAWICPVAGDWVLVSVLFIGATLFYYASYLEKSPYITAMSWLLFYIGIWKLLPASPSTDWQVIHSTSITAAFAYFAYWVHSLDKDEPRQSVGLVVTWLTLAIGLLASLDAPGAEYWAPGLLIAGSLTVGIEGIVRRQKVLIEVALYGVTLGLQRFVGLTFEDLNVVFYAHWWAVVIGSTAFWRDNRVTRLIVAMGIVTAISGIYALNEGGSYALLFLVEHLGLLVIGAIRGKSWAIWWGLVAAVLAVLYFLRDITFLAFGFLGLVIVGIVVWRLLKAADQSKKQG
jgi:hypothetical protein